MVKSVLFSCLCKPGNFFKTSSLFGWISLLSVEFLSFDELSPILASATYVW